MNEDLINVLKFKPLSMEHPNAWVGHMHFAYWLVKNIKPSRIVELGTHSGNSYFSFCQSVKENQLKTKCFAIDTWEGDEHAGSYDDSIFIKVNDHNEKHYANFSTLIRKKFDLALSDFSDKSIDILHIDGLHTYEAVRHDYETWLIKVADGGLILFHDIFVKDRNFGVYKLWEELLTEYPNFTYFKHSHGLGVIQVSKKINKIEWMKKDFSNKNFFIGFFEAIGLKEIERFNLLSQIKDKDQIIKDKDQIIKDKDQIIKDKDQIINDSYKDLEVIYSSRSWRITQPIRFFLKIIRKMKARITNAQV